MQAEVIAIGDELTSGQRIDTNTPWLCQQLGDLGIRVTHHTTVGDELPVLVQAFRATASRTKLAVLTGGLGPTADDLTRQALAEAAAVELVLDPLCLQSLQQRFASRGRTMPPRNQIQACFPRGSRAIDNPHGTAPGIDLEIAVAEGHSCRFFALPGVPAEMKQMWQQTVLPAIAVLRGPHRVIRHRRLKCFGVGESELEAMLPDLIRRGREPQVGITVHRATITLRVTAAGPDVAQCCAAMQPTIDLIHESLGSLVYGEEDDELQHVVLRQLAAQRQSLSICEWGTQGLVAHWLHQADDPRQSRLRGAVVVHGPAALQTLLNVSPDDPPGSDADLVSRMAQAVRRRSGSDLGLAIGAAPDPTVPGAQIHLALATADRVRSCTRSYAGHPDILQERTAKHALDLVRLHLLGADRC